MYSSFRAARTGGRFSMRGSLPNLSRAFLYVRLADRCFIISSDARIYLVALPPEQTTSPCLEAGSYLHRFRWKSTEQDPVWVGKERLAEPSNQYKCFRHTLSETESGQTPNRCIRTEAENLSTLWDVLPDFESSPGSSITVWKRCIHHSPRRAGRRRGYRIRSHHLRCGTNHSRTCPEDKCIRKAEPDVWNLNL